MHHITLLPLMFFIIEHCYSTIAHVIPNFLKDWIHLKHIHILSKYQRINIHLKHKHIHNDGHLKY